MVRGINGVSGLIGPKLFTPTFIFFIRSESTLSMSEEFLGAPFILASLISGTAGFLWLRFFDNPRQMDGQTVQ